MRPILNSDQLRSLDAKTIATEPISSIDLMERASVVFTEHLINDYSFTEVSIFCGPGNNGGDGLVIARLLAEKAKSVRVFVPPEGTSLSEDHETNLARLHQMGLKTYSYQDCRAFSKHEIIVDALFGSGLTRPLQGVYRQIIQLINQEQNRVISVDMPSGMPTEPASGLDICVQADMVYTFHNAKLSLLLPSADNYAKDFKVLDIGLVEFTESTSYYFIERSDIKDHLKSRSKFSHKYKNGHAMLVGGSKGKTGAIVLSSEAAYRAGCGLVTAYIPECALSGLQNYLPEVMYVLNGNLHIEGFEANLERVDAIGIGPGLGLDAENSKVLSDVLASGLPLVIDADAIRLIAKFNLQDLVPSQSILTPHEGELRALIGDWLNEKHKLDEVMHYCKEYNVIMLVKGAHSFICNGHNVYFNPIGHPAMGTAGSGDVLMGIIAGLRAQHYSAQDAAIIGAYIHSQAAIDFMKHENSATLIASDISKKLGETIKSLSAT